MDKLARQLREDASQIDCKVSAELDDRIRASLEAIQPEATSEPRRRPKSFPLWWASSLTGIAAAIGVIVVVNLQTQPVGPPVTEPAPQALVIPSIEWQTQPAALTRSLEVELENLQSDLEKAEEAVKQDIERLF
jgi:hypothetical protein